MIGFIQVGEYWVKTSYWGLYERAKAKGEAVERRWLIVHGYKPERIVEPIEPIKPRRRHRSTRPNRRYDMLSPIARLQEYKFEWLGKSELACVLGVAPQEIDLLPLPRPLREGNQGPMWSIEQIAEYLKPKPEAFDPNVLS